MFVNTNVSALQSVLDLQNTTNSMDNVLQQLSTGYQINSAADNPAGLAISQEMQTQITGLNTASQNSQNGISLLQTADGAMNNIDTILQSMRSLASQAASGTNNPTDLQALQQEMNQYAQEITNIANTTQFNNLNLLSGAFGGQVNGSYNSNGQYVGTMNAAGTENIQIGANQGEQISIGINPLDAASLNVAGVSSQFVASGSSFTGTVDASTLSTYLTNLGNGLYTSGGTNAYTVGVGTIGLVSAATTASMSLGTTTALTAVTLTNSSTADAAGSVTGNFTSPSTVTYTVTVTGVTANTVTYSVSGSDGFAASGLTTNVSSTAATNANNFTFTDGSSKLTLYGTAAAGTGYATGQTASFTLNPAYIGLGLFTGASTASANLVGSAATIGSNTVAANQVFYGSEVASNSGITLGNTSNSNQATLNDLGTLVGSITSTSSNYYQLTQLGSTLTAANLSFQFDVSSAGTAANVAGNGIVNTSATVTSGVNISTQGNAETALTVIDQALTDVNSQRAVLGAYQNELQFAVSNAQTGSNNLSAAQANILDTNMALQMANLSKYQVLQQSGIAMLAQANQIPQAILKLIG